LSTSHPGPEFDQIVVTVAKQQAAVSPWPSGQLHDECAFVVTSATRLAGLMVDRVREDLIGLDWDDERQALVENPAITP
jgi:hypothetical protein